MRNRALLPCLAACACTVSGPSSLPQLQAGPGIRIDGGQVSVDPAQYQTAAAADGKYLAQTGTAANAAQLGGLPPTSFAIKDSGGNVDLGAGRLVITSGSGGSAVSTSVFGLFCGATAATAGSISIASGMSTTTGYQAAKQLCEAATGCGPLAHMCRPAEMTTSLQLGAIDFAPFSDTALWVAGGVEVSASSGLVSDCLSYTSNAAGVLGATFVLKPGGANAGRPGSADCSGAIGIACCL